MKINIGLFFGGKSTEHEVSVITGLQAYAAVDTAKYDVIPIYITKENEFYTGGLIGEIEAYSDIPSLLKNSVRITLLNQNGRVCLYKFDKKNTLKPTGYAPLDVALPCVHGTNVEDGSLQGFFEILGLPYAGCDVISSAIGMDKAATKAILKREDIPVLDCVAFTSKNYIEHREELLEYFDKSETVLPAIVKPVNLGSSIGINIADNKDELQNAIENAFIFADRIIIERAVLSLKEVNCSVLGDRDNAEASECEEPVNYGGILDFNDKYTSGGGGGKGSKTGGGKSSGMASLKRKIPADISDEQRNECRELAVRAFKALGCCGVARIDFLIDTENDKIYFNEINTIPGSLSFYLWEAIGLKYPQLIDKMVSLALKRERERTNLAYSFESNILSGFKGGTKSGGKA